jgi:signal transduction histidine kinase
MEDQASMSPVRVLVVEDESIVALDIQHRLQAMGYEVVGLALTGPEAIELGGALHPDVALMDIQLRGPFSGIVTAEQLRANLGIPVVYLTAYADQATLERARVSEPFGYVIKPFEDRELNITLDIALYRHQTETRLRQSEARLRAAHDELERRVQDRTAELTRVNEQLRLEIAARERVQAERAAVQEERRRLAQEIHDSVTQSIFGVILATQTARRTAEHDASEPLEQTLDEIEDIARQALKDLRLLLYQLRSPLLEHAGLAEALRYRLDAVEVRAGITANLVAPDILEISPAAEEGAYRVAMEALNNSLKHAKATEVTVEIRSEGDEVELIVKDDGIGFDEAAMARSAGLGLAGMQERAARLGGKVIIRSQRDRGTSVSLRIHRFAQDTEDVASRVTG